MRALALLLLAAGCAPMSHGTMPSPAEGEALVQRRCLVCHSEAPIVRSVGSPSDWDAVVHRMVYHHKAKLFSHVSDEEAMAIAHYLAETQPPDGGQGVRIGPRPTGRPL